MKNYLFLVLTSLCLMAAGCDYKGVPVEYAHICDKANDKKTVEATGFFNNTGSAMCSKSGNEPMRCPIDFVEAPGAANPIRAYIDKGSGASSIDNIEEKGLKIRDKDNNFVENSEKVKVTASVKRLDNAGVDGCYITVKKIEK